MLTIEDKEFLLLLARAVTDNKLCQITINLFDSAEQLIQRDRDHEAWVDGGRQES